jgi:hypothetical protein
MYLSFPNTGYIYINTQNWNFKGKFSHLPYLATVFADNPFIYLRLHITIIEGIFEIAIIAAQYKACNISGQDCISDCGQLRFPDLPNSHTFGYKAHSIVVCVCVCWTRRQTVCSKPAQFIATQNVNLWHVAMQQLSRTKHSKCSDIFWEVSVVLIFVLPSHIYRQLFSFLVQVNNLTVGNV